MTSFSFSAAGAYQGVVRAGSFVAQVGVKFAQNHPIISAGVALLSASYLYEYYTNPDVEESFVISEVKEPSRFQSALKVSWTALKVLNPYATFESVRNIQIKRDFKQLTYAHMAITAVATATITCLTLGYFTSKYLKLVIGRFKKIEADAQVEKAAKEALMQQIKAHDLACELFKKEFWETLNGSSEQSAKLKRFWDQMYAQAAEGIISYPTQEIVDFYTAQKQAQDPSFTPDEMAKKKLAFEISAQKKNRELEKAEDLGLVQFDRALRSGGKISICATDPDGSCGFHALLGVALNGGYRCNARSERETFVKWLREKRHEGQLPDGIKNVLEDYFTNFERAHRGFKTAAVIAKYQEYLVEKRLLESQLQMLDPDPNNTIHQKLRRENVQQQEELLQKYIFDQEVFEAYLHNIGNLSTWLLQDELIAVAICFKKTMILLQPSWGGNQGAAEEVVNEGASEPVAVWYDGSSHYSRAFKS